MASKLNLIQRLQIGIRPYGSELHDLIKASGEASGLYVVDDEAHMDSPRVLSL
jgi:hypothetical protein